MPVPETTDRRLERVSRLSGSRYRFTDPDLPCIVTIGVALLDGVPEVVDVDITRRSGATAPVTPKQLGELPIEAMRRVAITLHSTTTRRGIDGVMAEYARPDPDSGPRPRLTQSEADDRSVIANKAACDRDEMQSPAEAAADALGLGLSAAKEALKLGRELGLPSVPRRGRTL